MVNCNGNCSLLCKGDCSGECKTECTASCGSKCSGGCKSSCSSGCDGGCASDCTSGCKGECLSSCKSACKTLCDVTCTSSEATNAYVNASATESFKASDMTNLLKLLKDESYRRQTTDTTQDQVTIGEKINSSLQTSVYNDIKAMSGWDGYSEPTAPTRTKSKTTMDNYLSILKSLYNKTINRDTDV